MTSDRIAIVGAGIAGLAAARTLQAAGFRPVVFDKGRRSGGRLATRQTREGPVFDHGAQHISARGEGFGAVIAGARASGFVELWDRIEGRPRYVGTPEMASFATYLGRALDVRLETEITGLRPARGGWTLVAGGDEMTFDRVVLTLPAPQAAALLGDHPLTRRLGRVAMAPCLTLMAAFRPGAAAPFAFREDSSADLSWIAYGPSKPGRAQEATWVAQAGEDWSRAHLETDKNDLPDLMLPMLCEAIGRAPDEATVLRGHRWRYARVTVPLGEPFLSDEAGTLYLGGDWCIGARVEAAWDSGTAIAGAIAGVV